MPQHPDTRLSYCGQQLCWYDHDRYLTCLFAPAEAREDFFALYAFNHEIAKVAEVVNEPIAGQIRIQWWREGLDGIFSGTPRKHQVAEAVSAAIRRHRLSRAPFERLLDARERDLDETPPQTLEALESYAEETSASLIALALEIVDARDEASQAAGRHVGIAWALVGLARAVPFHAAQRRLMIPGNIAWESGLDLHDLFELRQPKEVQLVVQAVAARAREHLDAAAALRPRVASRAVPALLPATLARQYLKALERHGYNPFEPRVQMTLPGRPLRLLWAATTGRY